VADVQKFLSTSKTLHKGQEYKLFEFVFGFGLLTAPVSVWKKTRKQYDLMFGTRNIEHQVANLNKAGRLLVRMLSDQDGRGQFDILEHIAPLSTANIFNLLFGLNMHHSAKSYQTVRELLYLARFTAGKRVSNFWLRWDAGFHFLYRKTLSSFQHLWEKLPERKLLDQDIELKQTTTRSKEFKIITSGAQQDGAADLLTFVDVCQSLRKGSLQFDDVYVRGEFMTLMVTGSESISVTMASCFLALASHPQIQEKVYHEIIEVVGRSSTMMTMADAEAMPYLDQFLQETMRRFTLVPIIARQSDEDIELSDCTLPAYTTTLICISKLNMDPDVFPDPHKFDPDRFSSENVAKRNKYAFLPFSGGPRNCVGKRYAMLSLKIVVATVLREYSFHTDLNIKDMEYKYGISQESVNGYPVSLKRRHS